MSLSLTNIVVLICMIIYVCYLSLDICLQDEPVTDKHCGTYWKCTNGQPKPTCCPEGYRFSLTSKMCEDDKITPCYESCPSGYEPGKIEYEKNI